jgi:hypothetical protein
MQEYRPIQNGRVPPPIELVKKTEIFLYSVCWWGMGGIKIQSIIKINKGSSAF